MDQKSFVTNGLQDKDKETFGTSKKNKKIFNFNKKKIKKK